MADIPPTIQLIHGEDPIDATSFSECVDLGLLSRCDVFLAARVLGALGFSGPPNAIPSELGSLGGGRNSGSGGKADVKSSRFNFAS